LVCACSSRMRRLSVDNEGLGAHPLLALAAAKG